VPSPDPSRRRVTFKADTRRAPSLANRVVPPAPGGPNDPRTAGATVTFYNSSSTPGHPTDAVTVSLAAANWKAIGKAIIYGYKYSGPDPNGPLSSVVIKNDSITVKGGRVNWGYSLDEPAQGRIGVRFTLGDGTGWCTDVPAKANGDPPSSANYDRQDRFVGQQRSPAPASCPALP
jgi:hypothetical protein